MEEYQETFPRGLITILDRPYTDLQPIIEKFQPDFLIYDNIIKASKDRDFKTISTLSSHLSQCATDYNIPILGIVQSETREQGTTKDISDPGIKYAQALAEDARVTMGIEKDISGERRLVIYKSDNPALDSSLPLKYTIKFIEGCQFSAKVIPSI